MVLDKEGKFKILVVDDDAASRGLMGVLLSEYGQCDFAANGTDAFDTVEHSFEKDQPYDLIFLDILMPEMDGLECLKRIREIEQGHQVTEGNEARVIMTTTVSQQAKVMRAFHYGCSGYLVKPISKENLAVQIAKLPPDRSSNTKWRSK